MGAGREDREREDPCAYAESTFRGSWPSPRRPEAGSIGVALSAALLTVLSAAPASAQDYRPTLTVTPMAGNLFFTSDLIPSFTVDTLETAVSARLENQFSPGLRAGIRISDYLSAEAGVHFAATELALDPDVGPPVGFNADLWMFGAGVRYRFRPRAAVSPFVAAGAGARHLDDVLTTDTETDFMWNVGAGALFDTGWVADVRVEVRDYMSDFRDEGAEESLLQHDLWAGVGLEFGVF